MSIRYSVRYVLQGRYQGLSLFDAAFDLTWLTCLSSQNGHLPGILRSPVQITRGTRLINSGVPQHVVQKLLGHASPHMTSHYAREDPRHHHPGGVRPLPVPAGQHQRAADRLRPRRTDRFGRMGQAQPQPGPRQPPQRLLRPPGPAGLPAPQRLPDLPGLPDHPRVLADPPAAGRHQPPPHHPGRRQRPAALGREPAPRPGQPGPDHPRPGSAQE